MVVTLSFRLRAFLITLVVCCTAGAVRSALVSQDVNWDQLNYHFYSMFALRHHRLNQDIAPGGIETFLNPLPYIPFYFLIRTFSPLIAGICLGALQAAVFAFIPLISLAVIGATDRRQKILTLIAACLISLASPLAISEIGTSFADLTVALPIIIAIWIILPITTIQRRGAFALIVGAFVMGVAAGLKLTNIVFCIGLVVACLLGWKNWRERLLALLCTAIGGTMGVLATGGFWAWKLWRDYGSPTFPYYNNVFKAPGYPPIAIHDPRWIPTSLLDGLSFPFQWAVGKFPSSEVAFRDIRFATILLLTTLAAAIFLIGRLLSKEIRRAAGMQINPAGPRLAGFFFTSFFVWLYLFGYQRYLVPLELLSGPLLVVLLRNCFGRAAVAWTTLTVALFSVWTAQIPDWGHTPWSVQWYGIQVPPALQDDGIYFLGTPPLGYVAGAFSPQARFINTMASFDLNADNPNPFTNQIKSLLAARPSRPARLLLADPLTDLTRTVLGSYGLNLAGDCQVLPAHFRPLTVCNLVHVPDHVPAALALDPGVVFSIANGSAVNMVVLKDGWSTPEGWGTWAIGHDASLLFRVPSASPNAPISARLRAQAFISANHPNAIVTVSSGRNQLAEWQFTLAHNVDDRTICIPASAMAPGDTINLQFHQSDPVSPAGLGISADGRAFNVGIQDIEILPNAAKYCAATQ